MKNPFYYLIIISLLLCGCSSDSDNQPENIPDVTAPELSINLTGFPSDSSNPIVVSNSLEINIDAKDDGGIAKIEAFLNDINVGEDTTAPYKIIVDVSSLNSKNGSTGKYKDYILKVTATDRAGNTQSKEQIINVDNEKPTITEVSLNSGSVINGDENIVTFDISDNEGINAIKIYLNNQLLYEPAPETTEININTIGLEDGENILKIEAIDIADNSSFFEVSFISDNTGPQIILNNLAEGEILDIPITLTPEISDEFSEIASFEVFYGEQNLFSSENPININFELDPVIFDTGDGAIVFVVKDVLTNESIISIPVKIMRRLTVLNFPQNFYDPTLARMYVFASQMSGELLHIERVFPETESIILRTSEDVSENFEFMLSFAKYTSYSTVNASDFTTIANVSNLPEVNLRSQPRFDSQQANYFPLTGFDDGDIYNTFGHNFGANAGLNLTDNQLRILTNNDIVTGLSSDYIYLWLDNLTLNEYSYTIFNSDLSQLTSVDKSQFTQTDIAQKTYNVQMSPGNSFERTSINIYAYFDEHEFQNDIFHYIGGNGYQFQPGNGFPYNLNTNMHKYRYEVSINDYYTERTGIPENLFTQKNWSIDYTFDNNQINISSSGLEHIVGKIIIADNSNGGIDVNGKKINYLWQIAYDSQKQTNIVLPEVPEELKSWGFYQFYEQNQLDFNQIQIRSYEGISDYQGYLSEVIKNNTLPYLVSPNMEAKVKSEEGTARFFDLQNFIID